ncbi:hypothetical protein L6452_42338 [Arctium lappa]|uniref:Uncharacterized protein n=1 Tax=Arctium lappa TaxID=4217 RepID=A0ACB8XI70_ARCLA|nr:hypothetical protein L6452_42338 [Arctium lappa]
MEPWRDLRGTIVMVTGASSGRVNQNQARNIDTLAVAVELDVSADAPTIEASVRKAWEAFGRINTLINNVGFRGPIRSSLDLLQEDWDITFNTNTRGSWLVSKYFCLKMLALDQGGSIINISSTAGVGRVFPPAVAYASSKSSLDTMTKVMAMELGKHKIRVNAICPGIFRSEITNELLEKKWFEKVVSRTVPLKDLGTTNPALTSLVKYLIHDSSNYMTGNVFIVDAGYSLAGVPLYSSL